MIRNYFYSSGLAPFRNALCYVLSIFSGSPGYNFGKWRNRSPTMQIINNQAEGRNLAVGIRLQFWYIAVEILKQDGYVWRHCKRENLGLAIFKRQVTKRSQYFVCSFLAGDNDVLRNVGSAYHTFYFMPCWGSCVDYLTDFLSQCSELRKQDAKQHIHCFATLFV